MLTFFYSYPIALLKMKILMVCLGNICRSPIAEGVMRSKFIKYKFNGSVDSAGVIGMHAGEAPDRRAIKISLHNEIDISQQTARKFNVSDFDQYDLILAMDQSVYDEIAEMATDQNSKNKVKLFLAYSGTHNSGDVPDPYYGGPEGFEKVFRMIDEGCENIIRKIQQS